MGAFDGKTVKSMKAYAAKEGSSDIQKIVVMFEDGDGIEFNVQRGSDEAWIQTEIPRIKYDAKLERPM